MGQKANNNSRMGLILEDIINHSLSLSNVPGKIYERTILQQEATNILEENNFFKGKNLYVYQKTKMPHTGSVVYNKCVRGCCKWQILYCSFCSLL